MNLDRSLAFTLLLHYGGDEFGKLDDRRGSYLVTDLVDYYRAGEPSPEFTLDRAAQEYMDEHRGKLERRAELLSLAMSDPTIVMSRFPYEGQRQFWAPTELNGKRADWGEAALRTFAYQTGQFREIRDLGIVEDVLDEIGGDLIGDLMHLCAKHGVDPRHVLDRAVFHFEAEYSGYED